MADTTKHMIDLAAEQAAYVGAKVDSGVFASVSEVVGAGLATQQERDVAIERWLQDEVLPVYQSVNADPTRAIQIDQVFDELETEIAAGNRDRG